MTLVMSSDLAKQSDKQVHLVRLETRVLFQASPGKRLVVQEHKALLGNNHAAEACCTALECIAHLLTAGAQRKQSKASVATLVGLEPRLIVTGINRAHITLTTFVADTEGNGGQSHTWKARRGAYCKSSECSSALSYCFLVVACK